MNTTLKLSASATIQIQKPIADVFNAIIDPAHMSHYFISTSSGMMHEGTKLQWQFPEFADVFPVEVLKTIVNQEIVFVWDKETQVRITLETMPDGSTLVKVHEGEKNFSEKNLQWALGNTGGWMNFLDCLKAYLEYGITLRKGAFDFMRKD